MSPSATEFQPEALNADLFYSGTITERDIAGPIVNTLTDNTQVNPAIAISGGNALIAWEDYASRPGDTQPTSIQAQAFSVPGFDYDSAMYGDFDNNGRSDLLFQSSFVGPVGVSIWTTKSLPKAFLPSSDTTLRSISWQGLCPT